MEKSIDGLFRLHLVNAGSIGYTVNNIKFDHGFGPPSAYLCEIGLILWAVFFSGCDDRKQTSDCQAHPVEGRQILRLTKRNGARDDGRQRKDDHASGQAQLISWQWGCHLYS